MRSYATLVLHIGRPLSPLQLDLKQICPVAILLTRQRGPFAITLVWYCNHHHMMRTPLLCISGTGCNHHHMMRTPLLCISGTGCNHHHMMRTPLLCISGTGCNHHHMMSTPLLCISGTGDVQSNVHCKHFHHIERQGAMVTKRACELLRCSGLG